MSGTTTHRMSLSRKARMISTAVAQVPNSLLVETISTALSEATANSASAAKEIANRTGRSVAAAKKWLAGNNAPGAAELIELIASFDEVHEAVLMLARRTPAKLTEQQADRVIRALAILEGKDAA